MAKYTPKKKAQLKRIRSFIRRAEKRGFTFAKELKENLSTFSTQKLKALKPEKLYKPATYKVGEETVSGLKGRKIERTIAAKKAVQTKIRRKEEREQREWERLHRDYIENISLSDYEEYEEEYIPSFTDIVLSEVEAMIKEAQTNVVYVGYGRTNKDNADQFEIELKSQIGKYGRDGVAISMENAPDETKVRARLTLMASSETSCHAHLEDLWELITGTIPTVNDSKSMNMET